MKTYTASSILISRMTSSSAIIPYIFQNTVTCFIVFILRESSWGASGVNPSPGPLFLVNYHYEYMVKNMLLQQPLCVRHSYSGSAMSSYKLISSSHIYKHNMLAYLSSSRELSATLGVSPITQHRAHIYNNYI